MFIENPLKPNRTVAFYARVSTEHDAQMSALENQKDWYKKLLEENPKWKMYKMYVDEGITGTSAEKRPQFMQMMDDAENGEFDLIVTREVSRFARNTVDTLQFTRELKAYGCEVYFVNDSIQTFAGDGELRLTIMATLAQDESRKTSIRVKAGQQTSMENGVFYGNGNILGYDRVTRNGVVTMEINPEQAQTVRMIYNWYLDGWGLRKIQFELEKQGRLTSTGRSNWHASNISKILKNTFYCGIITYHKQYTPSYLEQKKINNFNYDELPLVQVQGTHEPIVTVEEYERVQRIFEKSRRQLKNTTAGKPAPLQGERRPVDIWTKLLECECGHKFNRHAWHKTEHGVQYGYQCYSSIRTGTVRTREKKGLPTEGICRTPMIAGWKLQMMAKEIFRNYLSNKENIFNLAQQYLSKHEDDKKQIEDNTEIIEKKQLELDKWQKRLDNYIVMRADGDITKEQYVDKKTEAELAITKLQSEIDALLPEVEEEEDNHEERITVLQYALEYYSDALNSEKDIPEEIIEAFVVKVVAKENGFDWYMRFEDDPNNPENKFYCEVEGKKKTNAKVTKVSPPFVSCHTGSYRK